MIFSLWFLLYVFSFLRIHCRNKFQLLNHLLEVFSDQVLGHSSGKYVHYRSGLLRHCSCRRKQTCFQYCLFLCFVRGEMWKKACSGIWEIQKHNTIISWGPICCTITEKRTSLSNTEQAHKMKSLPFCKATNANVSAPSYPNYLPKAQ